MDNRIMPDPAASSPEGPVRVPLERPRLSSPPPVPAAPRSPRRRLARLSFCLLTPLPGTEVAA